jgi:hypothetical protein
MESNYTATSNSKRLYFNYKDYSPAGFTLIYRDIATLTEYSITNPIT